MKSNRTYKTGEKVTVFDQHATITKVVNETEAPYLYEVTFDETGKAYHVYDFQIKPAGDITDRVKTLDDAILELGNEHPFVMAWNSIYQGSRGADDEDIKDVIAYHKLRIIVAALNDGWKPEFSENEWRYYPYFILYKKEEYDELSKEEKDDGVLFGGSANRGASAGFAYALSTCAPSHAAASVGSRLCLKSSALAQYCGKQFIDIWKDFVL